MFWRIFFSIIIIGTLGTMFKIIYFGEITNKTRGAIVADVARGIGYKTEQQTYGFWGKVGKTTGNIYKELQKPVKNGNRK